MYPHRIRLRGPWKCEPLVRFDKGGAPVAGDLPAPFRMTMPGRWSDGGLQNFCGVVRFVRSFGYPGRIDDFERVWLTFEGVAGKATATLNGESLDTWEEGPAEYEVSRLLELRNTLVVDVEAPTATGGIWGEVALEIRATAFLRDVAFHLDGDSPCRLRATGLVVGSAGRRLDLYLFAAGNFQAHATTLAAAVGQPFELAADVPSSQALAALGVRVELVDAATIWYVVERSVQAMQSNDPRNSS